VRGPLEELYAKRRATDADTDEMPAVKTCWIVSASYKRCTKERVEIVVECDVVHGPDALSTYLVIPRGRPAGLSGIPDRWVVSQEMVFSTKAEAWDGVFRLAWNNLEEALHILRVLRERYAAATGG
jgi:hypothetical protein